MQQVRQDLSRQEVRKCPVSVTSTLPAISIPCLYTRQKMKKRKTFNDGFLKVYESNGHCSLYSASVNFVTSKEESLDSQFILPSAAKKILQGRHCLQEFTVSV